MMNSYQRACSLLDMPTRPHEQPGAILDAMLAYLLDGVSRDNPDWLFRNLFLRRLPAEIRSQLMDDENEPVWELAKQADKMWSGRAEAVTAAPLAVCAVEQAEEAVMQHCTASATESGTHQCCAVQSSGQKLCCHHRRWGTQAYRCQPPCDWLPKEEYKKVGNGQGWSWN